MPNAKVRPMSKGGIEVGFPRTDPLTSGRAVWHETYLNQTENLLVLMQMFLLRPVKAGESISISYGDLLNDFLLLDYGAHCLQWTCSSIPTPCSSAAVA